MAEAFAQIFMVMAQSLTRIDTGLFILNIELAVIIVFMFIGWVTKHR
jgi:hypothetical protein